MAAMTTTIRAVIEADTTKLDAGLRKAGDSLKKFGSSTTQSGKSMTAGVTLPLIGAGLGAFKTASDFESSMAKIQSLVGLSAETVQGFEKDVLDLAGETGRAPKELADAMFFITSAGLRGADAVEALTASAKAAAAGLGDTEIVSDAVTNALNGYEAGSISAAEATDILVKTVEQGKASAADLAPQFGRLVPMAAELGVGFDQLGGGLAFLTRSSGDASQAAVGLKGIMSKLVKPSQQGVKELEKMGMSMGDLRKHVREKGLLATLNMLKTASEENGFEMTKFFEDVEGLNGVLALTGPKAAEAREVFDELSNSTGKLDEAFAIAADTTEVKMNQAMAGMKTLLIELGSTIIPIVVPMVQKLTGFISDLSAKFRSLNPRQQKMIIVLAGVAAAIGPVLIVAGKLMSVFGSLIKIGAVLIGVLGKLAVFVLGLSAPVLITIAVIAALAAAFVIAYKKSETFRNIVDSVRRWFVNTLWPAMKRIPEQLVAVWESLVSWFSNTLWPTMKQVGEALIGAWEKVAAFAKEFLAPIVEAAFGAMVAVGERFMDFGRALVDWFKHLVTGDWSELWSDFKELVKTATLAIIELFIKLPAQIIEAAWPLVKKLATFAASAGWSLLTGLMDFTTQTLLPWIQGLPDKIVAAIGKFIVLIFEAGKHLGLELLEGFKEMLLDIGSLASTVASAIVAFGGKLVDWIVEGIKGAAGAIGDAIMGAVPTPGEVLGGLGDFLGGLNPFGGDTTPAPAPSVIPQDDRFPKMSSGSTGGGKAVVAPVRNMVLQAQSAVAAVAAVVANTPTVRAAAPQIPRSQRTGMFGSGGPPGTGGGIVVNVAGSVITERDLAETIRQVSLRSQQSGKAAVI